MNVSGEQERIDIEKMRDSLSASLAALSGAIPQMATQGQDPSDIVEKIAKVIDARRKGTSIEEAVMQVFEKPEPEEPAETEQPEEAMGMPELGIPPQEEVPPQEQPTQAPQGQQPPMDINAILAQMGGGM
jgi:hypothetical protein